MWKRTKHEINKELEEVKELMPIYEANRDVDEARYQYWRGVRNALLWIIYNMDTPIRHDHEWEIGKEPKPLQADIEALAKAKGKQ